MDTPQPAATFTKPYVRMHLTEEEQMLVTTGAKIFHLIRNGDNLPGLINMLMQPDAEEAVADAEDVDPGMLTAQTSMLLIGRFFAAAIRAGNTLDDSHAAVIQLLSHPPAQTAEIVMQFCEVDLSDITGEPPHEYPPLDNKMERLARRIEKTFHRTAIGLPIGALWAKMGLEIGFDEDKVSEAASSHLDINYIFGDLTCNCDYCTE